MSTINVLTAETRMGRVILLVSHDSPEREAYARRVYRRHFPDARFSVESFDATGSPRSERGPVWLVFRDTTDAPVIESVQLTPPVLRPSVVFNRWAEPVALNHLLGERDLDRASPLMIGRGSRMGNRDVATSAETPPFRLLVAATHARGIADPVARQRAVNQLALTLRRLGYDRPDAAALGIDV